MRLKIVCCCMAAVFAALTLQAQDKFCKVWYTSERKSKIEIYLGADGKYYGKIVWLRDGTVNGKPLIDIENPDKTKRGRTWLGLELITGLVKKSERELVSGKIYDPQKGNFYDCKITLSGDKVLLLHGYILGLPFLGKTTTWYLDEDHNLSPGIVNSEK